MKTGLVVLNYNDSETVIGFLKKIEEYKNLDHIVVVDNCSTDGSYERILEAVREEAASGGAMAILGESSESTLSMAKKEEASVCARELFRKDKTGRIIDGAVCGKITLIRAEENKGYAAGNNLGVRYLMKNFAPDFIVVANPDVFFTEETLTTMTGYLKKLPDAGLISCRMRCLSAISMPSAWKLPKFRDCLFQDSFIIKKIFGDATEYREDHFTGQISRVDVVQGSLFAFRPEAFKLAHGFDEHTFLYYEENIIARRLKKAGRQNYLVNTCSYDHYHSVSINKSIASVKKRLDIAYESRLWYCRRYLKINRLQEVLMGLFHTIGVFNYLVYKRLSSGAGQEAG